MHGYGFCGARAQTHTDARTHTRRTSRKNYAKRELLISLNPDHAVCITCRRWRNVSNEKPGICWIADARLEESFDVSTFDFWA